MSRRFSRRGLAASTVLPLVATGIVGFGAITAPAHAACLDGGDSWTVSKAAASLIKRDKGQSIYNGTLDNMTRSLSSTTTTSTSDTHTWTAGAGGGFSIGIWSAKVSGSYGQASVTGVSSSTTVTDTFTIRPKYSGWEEAQTWYQNYTVKLYHTTLDCPIQGTKLVSSMTWRDAYLNKAAMTQSGRVSW
jgi:hypothetical protein